MCAAFLVTYIVKFHFFHDCPELNKKTLTPNAQTPFRFSIVRFLSVVFPGAGNVCRNDSEVGNGDVWRAPEGWTTGFPSLHLNLDDDAPYTMHGNASHISTPVRQKEKPSNLNDFPPPKVAFLTGGFRFLQKICSSLPKNGMGIQTMGDPDYADLGDWSNATCFADVESCTTGENHIYITLLKLWVLCA